jgi:hypothetical protein
MSGQKPVGSASIDPPHVSPLTVTALVLDIPVRNQFVRTPPGGLQSIIVYEDVRPNTSHASPGRFGTCREYLSHETI